MTKETDSARFARAMRAIVSVPKAAVDAAMAKASAERPVKPKAQRKQTSEKPIR